MSHNLANFSVGQIIRHRLFDYRGVVFDIDPVFQGSDDWYARMARTRPPKDAPWYHVLVDKATHTTYVAERNLVPDNSGERISHPALDELFAGFRDGRYVLRDRLN